MGFSLLALGYVDSGAGQPEDLAGLAAQWLNMEVMPAHALRVFYRHLRALRLPAGQRLELQLNDPLGGNGRQDLLVRASEDILGRAAEHAVADRRVSEVAVLRIDDDLRAAQRR